jgi:hypothetical protein
VPNPKKGESESDYVSRCMSKMADDHPDWDEDRRAAACYSMYEARKGLWARLRKSLEKINETHRA